MDIVKKIVKPVMPPKKILKNFRPGQKPILPPKYLEPYLPLLKKFRESLLLNIIITFSLLIVGSLLIYAWLTTPVPATGGELREGIIGQPQYINPVLSFSNDVNKPDRVLEYLIYPSLFRLDKNGNLSPELVSSSKTDSTGREYTLTIRNDVVWDDGVALTTEDIIFTIQTIQNPNYNSPLASALRGVSLTKVDDYTVTLSLASNYTPFLSNLTFGIMPKHIWQNLSANEFLQAEANLKPVGAGKFRYKSIQKNKAGNIVSYSLEKNPLYFGQKPNINIFSLVFYGNEQDMLQDFQKNNIQAFSQVKNPLNLANDFSVNQLNIPQAFGIIFNTKDPLLENKEIRQAINHSLNRQIIVQDILKNQASEINGPLTPFNNFYIDTPTEYNLAKAQQTLEEANWKDVDGDGIREKDNRRAEFSLLVADGNKVAEISQELQTQIKQTGIQMNIEVMPFAELNQNQIRNRSYQAIFLGIGLNVYPDPYIYWHSSQTRYPGLNLSQYSNINNDGYLESARTNTDESVISSSLQQFQQLQASDIPAIFLYTPKFLYYTQDSVTNITLSKGNTSVDRYASISDWFVRTRRTWK